MLSLSPRFTPEHDSPAASDQRTTSVTQSAQWRRRVDLVLATALLAGLAIIAYWGIWKCQFVNFDDGVYVVDNENVKGGLTPENVRWAWTSFRASNWHPLTWLSLELDASLFGPGPNGFHVTNLFLHCVNGFMLLLVCGRIWPCVWPGALVALLFVLHPQHVESVAWVSERKDVLSTMFGLIALLAYSRYADRPSVGRYLAVMAALALSLLAKPMLVTLPCLLLVWDWWPLGRSPNIAFYQTGRASAAWRRLVLEKVPLFAVAVASCVVTVWSQHVGGALRSLDDLGVAERCANAVAGYAFYVSRAIWPRGLSVFCPPAASNLVLATLFEALVGLGVTAASFWLRRRQPCLLFGWLWFLGTLVPVIGLVQVAAQAYADRYSYFPMIGLLVIFAEAVRELSRVRWSGRAAAAIVSCGVVAACAVLTREQKSYWHDSQALWEHALAVDPDNYCAHQHMADLLATDGRIDEAIDHAKQALEHWPYQISHVRLAELLVQANRYEDALEQYSLAVRAEPADADSHLMLGNLLLQQDRPADAVGPFQTALAWRPGWADAHNGLGTAYAMQDEHVAARRSFLSAVEAEPANTTYLNNLGTLLARMGDRVGALAAFDRALRVDPHCAEASNRRGDVLASLGRWSEAAAAYQSAIEQDGNVARYRFNLAVAHRERGETELARRAYEAALKLDPDGPR